MTEAQDHPQEDLNSLSNGAKSVKSLMPYSHTNQMFQSYYSDISQGYESEIPLDCGSGFFHKLNQSQKIANVRNTLKKQLLKKVGGFPYRDNSSHQDWPYTHGRRLSNIISPRVRSPYTKSLQAADTESVRVSACFTDIKPFNLPRKDMRTIVKKLGKRKRRDLDQRE